MEKKYPKNSNVLDKEWQDMVTKLLKPMSRLRLTIEEEQIIKKITDKL
jgi:hypothetical protein